MKKTLAACICILIVKASSAQNEKHESSFEDGAKVHYTIEETEIKNSNNLYLGITPAYISLRPLNKLDLGYGVFGEYLFNRGNISMSFSKPYVDGYDVMKTQAETESISKNSFVGYNLFEIGGSYFFSDVTKKTEVPFLVKTQHSGNLTIRYIIKVDAELRKAYGTRLGVVRYQSVISNAVLENQMITASDRTVFPGSNNYSTNMISSSLYMGLTFKQVANIVLNTEEYGLKRSVYNSSTYFDILYAPSLKIEDMIVAGKSYNVDGAFTKQKIGWRVGMDSKIMFGKKFGGALGFEMGSRPGVKIENKNNHDLSVVPGNLYVLAKYSVLIGFRK